MRQSSIFRPQKAFLDVVNPKVKTGFFNKEPPTQALAGHGLTSRSAPLEGDVLEAGQRQPSE